MRGKVLVAQAEPVLLTKAARPRWQSGIFWQQEKLIFRHRDIPRRRCLHSRAPVPGHLPIIGACKAELELLVAFLHHLCRRPFAATQAPIFYSQLRTDRLSLLDTQDGRLQSDGL